MTFWLLLALGGMAGALARYTVVRWLVTRAGSAFPWGTLAVNGAGSFLLGVVLSGMAGAPFEAQLGALIVVGFLGDFTTFSTYAYETVALVRQRRWTQAFAYQFGSVGLAVLGVVAGLWCGAALRAATPGAFWW